MPAPGFDCLGGAFGHFRALLERTGSCDDNRTVFIGSATVSRPNRMITFN